MEVIHGACWIRLRGIKPPCGDDEYLWQGACYSPLLGSAGPGKNWHHIVEQTEGNIQRFGAPALHNTQNVIRLEEGLHTRVSAFYSRKNWRITGSDDLTVRQWLSTQSYEVQRAFGLKAIENIAKGIW